MMEIEKTSDNKRQKLLAIIEELKNGLMAAATDGSMDTGRYRELRKTITGLPVTADLIPMSIRTCQNPSEYRRHCQSKFDSYKDRRDYIVDEFRPLIDTLENHSTTIPKEETIGEEIGRGGFGRVYKSRHNILDMDFAIKILDPAFDNGEQSTLDRFFREARILFALNHPNIIRIFDVGLINGKPFIKMEYFNGINLNKYFIDHGCMTINKAKILVKKMAQALNHAHSEVRVVHRDLKPSNIMVAPNEQVKIIDFGLGIYIENDIISRITKTGEKPTGGYYTAPELISNPTLTVPSIDIYSLGAIWYTALLGNPPAGIGIEGNLKKVSYITEKYIKCISKCLANTDSRYETCEQLLTDIDKLEL